MNSQTKQKLVLIAVAGIAAGLTACGGSTPPPDAAAAEPAMEKHGCKGDASGKNGCSGQMKDDMKKGEMKEDAPAPAPSADPMK